MTDDDERDDKTTEFVRGQLPDKPTADPYRTAGSVVGGAAMFGNFNSAKNRKAPAWAAPLLTGAVAIHVLMFVSMWIKSIWEIEQLERPKTEFNLSMAPPPPPPPPPPPGGAKPQTPQITPKKIKVKDIVQPVKIEKQEAKVEESGDPNGVEGGEIGGVAGGVVGGDLNGVAGAPPPPPPPPAPPQNVPPTLLESSRYAGEKQIIPDDVTKTEIGRSGKDKLIGSFKICLSATGEVTAVTMLKSTSFPAYDNKIQGKMRNEWKYRPFAVNGKAVPVCTAVTFIYSQK